MAHDNTIEKDKTRNLMIRLIDSVALLHTTIPDVPHANLWIQSLKSQALNTHVLSVITPNAPTQELFIVFPSRGAISCTLEKPRGDCPIEGFLLSRGEMDITVMDKTLISLCISSYLSCCYRSSEVIYTPQTLERHAIKVIFWQINCFKYSVVSPPAVSEALCLHTWWSTSEMSCFFESFVCNMIIICFKIVYDIYSTVQKF